MKVYLSHSRKTMNKMEDYISHINKLYFFDFILELTDHVKMEDIIKNIHHSPYVSLDLIIELDNIIQYHAGENSHFEHYYTYSTILMSNLFEHMIGNQISEEEILESPFIEEITHYMYDPAVNSLVNNKNVSIDFAKKYLNNIDFFYFCANVTQDAIETCLQNEIYKNKELINLNTWNWFNEDKSLLFLGFPAINLDRSINVRVLKRNLRKTRNLVPKYTFKNTGFTDFTDSSMIEKNKSYHFKSLPENYKNDIRSDRYSGRSLIYISGLDANYDLDDLFSLYYSGKLKDNFYINYQQTSSSTWNTPKPLLKLKTLISMNNQLMFNDVIEKCSRDKEMFKIDILLKNKFEKQMHALRQECLLFWQKKTIIENYLHKCIWDPRSTYRQKILNEQYDSYFSETDNSINVESISTSYYY